MGNSLWQSGAPGGPALCSISLDLPNAPSAGRAARDNPKERARAQIEMHPAANLSAAVR